MSTSDRARMRVAHHGAGDAAPARAETRRLAEEAMSIAQDMVAAKRQVVGHLRATWFFRSFVVAASIAFVALPYLVWWADQPGRDAHSVVLLYVTLTGGFFGLGWVGWSSIAASNARAVTSRGVSPMTAPVALVLSVALAGVPWAVDRSEQLLVTVPCMALAVLLQVWVWNSYRFTAALVGAESKPWSRMVWLPFVEAPLVVMFNRLIAIDRAAARIAGFVCYALLAAAHLWTYVQAMTAWDQALARRRQLRA